MFIIIGYQAAHEGTSEPEYDNPGNSSPTNRLIEQEINLSPTVNMNENMAYGHINCTDHVETNVNVAYVLPHDKQDLQENNIDEQPLYY